MRFLIGIDDTDNSNSRGTGNLARELGSLLQRVPGVRLLEITRHQLLISPLILYTSHNGCICLAVDAESRDGRELELECRSFLLHNSASGANAGMALVEFSEVPGEIIEWGSLAKRQVLDRRSALDLARRCKIGAAGLTGDGRGVIGALAALGLRAGGSDGRFLWLPGLLELSGVLTLTQLLDQCSFGRVETLRGRTPRFEDTIDVGEWARPILRGGSSVLLVEENPDHQRSDWRVLEKSRIKQLSE